MGALKRVRVREEYRSLDILSKEPTLSQLSYRGDENFGKLRPILDQTRVNMEQSKDSEARLAQKAAEAEADKANKAEKADKADKADKANPYSSRSRVSMVESCSLEASSQRGPPATDENAVAVKANSKGQNKEAHGRSTMAEW